MKIRNKTATLKPICTQFAWLQKLAHSKWKLLSLRIMGLLRQPTKKCLSDYAKVNWAADGFQHVLGLHRFHCTIGHFLDFSFRVFIVFFREQMYPHISHLNVFFSWTDTTWIFITLFWYCSHTFYIWMVSVSHELIQHEFSYRTFEKKWGTTHVTFEFLFFITCPLLRRIL